MERSIFTLALLLSLGAQAATMAVTSGFGSYGVSVHANYNSAVARSIRECLDYAPNKRRAGCTLTSTIAADPGFAASILSGIDPNTKHVVTYIVSGHTTKEQAVQAVRDYCWAQDGGDACYENDAKWYDYR